LPRPGFAPRAVHVGSVVKTKGKVSFAGKIVTAAGHVWTAGVCEDVELGQLNTNIYEQDILLIQLFPTSAVSIIVYLLVYTKWSSVYIQFNSLQFFILTC
jgi:hypothetical protein